MNLIRTIMAGGLILASAGTAYAQNDDKSGDPEEGLIQALNNMAQGRDTPPGQNNRPDDPDQGDDNAAREAILTVCTKDTPAADRSAICDGEPVSPE